MFIIDLMLGSAEHDIFLFGVHGAWRDAGAIIWNVLDLFSNAVMHAAAERRRRRFFCHAADAEKNARRDSAWTVFLKIIKIWRELRN